MGVLVLLWVLTRGAFVGALVQCIGGGKDKSRLVLGELCAGQVSRVSVCVQVVVGLGAIVCS